MQKQFTVTIDGRAAHISGAHPDELAKEACRQLGLPHVMPDAWWRQSAEADRAIIQIMPRPIALPFPLYDRTGEMVLSGEIDECAIDGTTSRTFGARYIVSGRLPGLRHRFRPGEQLRYDSLIEAMLQAQEYHSACPEDVVSITAMVADINQERAVATYYLSPEQAYLAAAPQTH